MKKESIIKGYVLMLGLYTGTMFGTMGDFHIHILRGIGL